MGHREVGHGHPWVVAVSGSYLGCRSSRGEVESGDGSGHDVEGSSLEEEVGRDGHSSCLEEGSHDGKGVGSESGSGQCGECQVGAVGGIA